MSETVVRIPTIETERLRLRAPAWSDFEPYAAFRGSLRASYAGGPFTRSQAYEQFTAIAGHWIIRGYGRWIVADRESDRALGVVGPFYPEGWLEPEIAWAMFEEAAGKGVAFEAAMAARAHAYETLGWTTAVSMIAPDNARSASLAERMGATREGLYHHESYGALNVWRHPSAAALRQGAD